jgi:hypothetical protein
VDRSGVVKRKWVYVLRSDLPSGVSCRGFRWPESGPVEAPDWNDRAECGGGLHGLLWGCGDAGLLRDANGDETRWRVVKVLATDVVDLGGKVKFPRGEVVYCGGRDGAIALLDRMGAADKPVVYAVRSAGYRGTATAGYRGTATAGYRGTATAGGGGTATAGGGGTATAGYQGTATAGGGGTATAGGGGTATAGYQGTATAGDWGTASAGGGGTASAGYEGTASAGDEGTATAGYRGTASAGYEGTIQVKWWDGRRYRIATGYVDENGIEPDVPYRCDDRGNLVRADQ